MNESPMDKCCKKRDELMELMKVRKNAKIAIVVSDRYKRCLDFLIFHGLNPRKFICEIEPHKLLGLDYNIPVIITYHDHLSREMWETIGRFKSVRCIDY